MALASVSARLRASSSLSLSVPPMIFMVSPRPVPRCRARSAHAAAKAAGAAVAALGRPRGQVPLIDLLFGDGKPLEPEGQALGCSVCEHATRRRWSRDPEVQN